MGHDIDAVAQSDGVQRHVHEESARSVPKCGEFLRGRLSIPPLRRPADLVSWIHARCCAVRISRRLHPEVIYANTPRSLMWACATAGRSRVSIVCALHGVVGRPIGRPRAFMARGVRRFSHRRCLFETTG